MVCKYFFILICISIFLNRVFHEVKVLNFNLSVFFCIDHVFGDKSMTSLLTLRPEDFLLCFFPKSFIALCFTFKSLVHFELFLYRV